MSNVNPEVHTDDNVSFRITRAHKKSSFIQNIYIHTNITLAAAATCLDE